MSDTNRAKLIKFTKLCQDITELEWIVKNCDVEIDKKWRDEASTRALDIHKKLENW